MLLSASTSLYRWAIYALESGNAHDFFAVGLIVHTRRATLMDSLLLGDLCRRLATLMDSPLMFLFFTAGRFVHTFTACATHTVRRTPFPGLFVHTFTACATHTVRRTPFRSFASQVEP